MWSNRLFSRLLFILAEKKGRHLEDFSKINEIFLQVLGVGIFGALGAMARQFLKMWKELHKKNKQLDELLVGQKELGTRLDAIEKQGNLRQEASIASLHDRIYSGYEIILKRGAVTMKELNNMSHLWDAYSRLGGNGTGKKMYERILEMPVIDNEEEEK